MKRTAAAALMLLFLLAACSPAPEASPTPTAAPTPSPAPEPTPTQLASSPWLEDYNYFWDVIEENYPLYHAVKRITGNDLAEVRERYLPQAQEAQTSWQLYLILRDINKAFQGSGHFSVLERDYYRSYWSLLGPLQDNPKFRWICGQLANPNSMDFYGYYPPDEWLAQAASPPDSAQSKSALGIENPSSNLSFADYPEYGAGYVKVYSMGDIEQCADPLAVFFSELEAQGYDNCIIDIRGNGGGSDNFWQSNLVIPNLYAPSPYQSYALVRGPLALDYFTTAFGGTDKLQPIGELPVDELPALDPEDFADATHFINYDRVLFTALDKPLFTGRFWLLVDEGVYSASESFALFCKQTGFATLVGETTGGDGIGIDPMFISLPDSGIVFRFTGEEGLNPDGSCNEEYGTTPDIVIEGGQDALEVCLEAISAEK